MRTLLVYGIILPVAVVVGWMLSSPLQLKSLTVIGAVVFILLLPLILSHHYALLVFSWNAMLTAFFLPGQPFFWTIMVAINVAIALAYRILQRRPMFISAPSLTISIVLLLAVVIMTAQMRGGIGFRVLGSGTYGSKPYFYIAMALLGYFALASRAIPFDKLRRYTGLFYLSGFTGIISNIIYFFPSSYFLYALFPVAIAISQAQADYGAPGAMSRLGGLAIAGGAAVLFMLARWGIRGMLESGRIWRLGLFAVCVGLGLFGGYRSTVLFTLLLCAVLFVLDGLVRTRWFFVLLLASGLAFSALALTVQKLPRPVQRALSVLPLDVDQSVRLDAQGSWEWRVQMWQALLPDLPKYFWLGKGYALNPAEMYLTQQSVLRGLAPDYASSLLVGDYHNGPLSVYVPFGAPGVIAFIFFLVTCGRALYLNYRNGPTGLISMNRFLLAFFIAKTIFFFSLFGSLSSDLATFTGIIGISVALNRGICRKPVTVQQRVMPQQLGFAAGAA